MILFSTLDLERNGSDSKILKQGNMLRICLENKLKYAYKKSVKPVKDSRNLRDMVCLSRPYPFKLFKSCVPQNLLGPFLNTLFHMMDFFLGF